MTGDETASSSEALKQGVSPARAAGTTGSRRVTRALLVARVTWAGVAIPVLAVFGAKLVVLFTALGHPSPVARAALDRLDISPAFRAAYILTFETLFALVFSSWQAPWNWGNGVSGRREKNARVSKKGGGLLP